MWERRSYNDGTSSRCTVKYRGTIPPWGSNTIALGVEWDDENRGKNNGDINGVRYFECQVANAGSFIKESRAYEQPVSTDQAIIRKYVENEVHEEIQLSKLKTIETVGIGKIHRRQAQIELAEVISLEACLVNKIDLTSQFQFTNLERLDLSNNLLSDFGEVVEFINGLTKLKSLRLNGNRFNLQGKSLPECRIALEELELAFTCVTEREIAIIATAFPRLQQLGLAHNRLMRVPFNLPRNLKSLDLANNPIAEFLNLSPSLTEVYLSHTEILAIPPNPPVVPSLIDLRELPQALSWSAISELGEAGVKDLRIDHALDGEAVMRKRPFIIARCPQLTSLDGTVVSAKERNESELYTLNAVARKTHQPLPKSRWEQLVSKYGEPSVPPNKSIRARLVSFYIHDDIHPLRIVKDAPLFRLHWLIANTIKRPPHSFCIRGIDDTPIDEKDTYSSLAQVGDLVSDGQHLELVDLTV